jgi:hypothetical protein
MIIADITANTGKRFLGLETQPQTVAGWLPLIEVVIEPFESRCAGVRYECWRGVILSLFWPACITVAVSH